jgi:UPF0755 protein
MKSNIRVILFLVVTILGISFTYYGYQIVYTPNILIDRNSKVLIIEEGESFKDIQKKLHDGSYVNDLVAFSFLAKIMGYDEQLKPGRYVLQPNTNNIQALRLLRSGKQEPVNVTFNNIRLPMELGERITRNLSMNATAFDSALQHFVSTNTAGFNEQNVIAMFIPNTYKVYYNVKPDALIERMHQEYDRYWNDQRKDKAKAIGLTPLEVSTLASIVQSESIREDEAPIIAGLYINRLKKGIPLQADPTLKFAAGDFALKRILNIHKEIESPYNTYKYAGLPPGPIAMPTISALEAVLNYTPSNYIYMCAKEDFSGRHNFTDNYNEHLRNAARYQQALTIEQRKGALLRK